MKDFLPIIGMSPGNSYFKHKEVAYLLKETLKKYDKAVIMVADEPAISTYQAMGYNFSKARSKAILKGNNLKNRAKSVLESMGLDSDHIIVVNRSEEVSNNEQYLVHLKVVQKLFSSNKQFKDSVLSSSQAVLDSSGKEYNEESVNQATNYLISEIAFLEFAPKYFGVKQVAYVYHKPWRVYEDYIAGIYDGITRFHLDFHLLESPYETYLSMGERSLSRLDIIKERGAIRCAYVPYSKGLFHIDGESYSGLFYEKIKQIADNNNLSIEFVEQSGYGVLAERINGGSVDVFCAPVRPTKSRRLQLFFTESIIKSNIYGYMRSDSKYSQKSLSELIDEKELRVVVKENDIHHDIVNQYLPNARIVWLPQLAKVGEEINYVLDNRADIAFWEDTLVSELLTSLGVEKNILVEKSYQGGPVVTYDNCMALPWGEFKLKEMLDEGV